MTATFDLRVNWTCAEWLAYMYHIESPMPEFNRPFCIHEWIFPSRRSIGVVLRLDLNQQLRPTSVRFLSREDYATTKL